MMDKVHQSYGGDSPRPNINRQREMIFPFAQLPNELQAQVASCLCDKDVQILQLSCKSLYAASHNAFSKRLRHLKIYWDIRSIQELRSISQSPIHARSVHFVEITSDNLADSYVGSATRAIEAYPTSLLIPKDAHQRHLLIMLASAIAALPNLESFDLNAGNLHRRALGHCRIFHVGATNDEDLERLRRMETKPWANYLTYDSKHMSPVILSMLALNARSLKHLIAQSTTSLPWALSHTFCEPNIPRRPLPDSQTCGTGSYH